MKEKSLLAWIEEMRRALDVVYGERKDAPHFSAAEEERVTVELVTYLRELGERKRRPSSTSKRRKPVNIPGLPDPTGKG